MNNPFNNIEILDWFLKCFEFSEIGVKYAVTTGSGPFEEEEFDNFLKQNGVSPSIPSEVIETLIVGFKDLDESVLLDTLSSRANNSLKVYSQEMFISFLLTGIDPYESDDGILELFTENHPVFEYFDSYGFDWPSTYVNDKPGETEINANWLEKGFLGWLNYKVGKSGHSLTKRHQILNRAFNEQIPSIFPTSYINEWGAPRSHQRLMKIANSIASFCRTAKRRKRSNTEVAINDWESDLEWLRNEFYNPLNYGFNWPLTI
jgi:hypothetical protein